jgi:CHAT domain-containing protein
VDLPDVSYSLLNGIFLAMAECEKLALSGQAPAMPDHALQRHLNALHRAFVSPLSGKLPAGGRVVLSLTQELSLLPINIAFNENTGKYFCEEYTLSFVPGLNALYWLLRAESNRNAGAMDQRRLLSVVHPGHTKASRLRFAQKESEMVADHFTAPPSSVILNESKALIADILQHCNNGGFDAIHFACHGNFNAEDPAHSGLMLADGVLTAERVQASVELKNRPLVLLSACQTGQVAITAGDEAIGLVQSFFAAGAGTVVASQWSVNDASSLEIFRQYFEFSRSVSRAEALRQAALAVKKMPGWSHPLYWAAFTVTGIAD